MGDLAKIILKDFSLTNKLPKVVKSALYAILSDKVMTKTKVKSPQTNGICERAHQTILNEFYRVTFRKMVYTDLKPCKRIWMSI